MTRELCSRILFAMFRPHSAVSLAVAIATVVLLALAPAAEAAALVRADAAYDVVRRVCTTEGCTQRPAPGVQNGDIRRTESRLVNHHVEVTAFFADVRSGRGRAMTVRLVTNEGVVRWARLAFTTTWPGGELTLHRTLGGPRIDCSAGSYYITDFSADVLSVGIHRTCLGSPASVRVGVKYARATSTGTLLDDAGRNGGPVGARPILGARLVTG